MSKVDGKSIKLIDVENNVELREHYKRFGFLEDGSENFTLEISKFNELMNSFIL